MSKQLLSHTTLYVGVSSWEEFDGWRRWCWAHYPQYSREYWTDTYWPREDIERRISSTGMGFTVSLPLGVIHPESGVVFGTAWGHVAVPGYPAITYASWVSDYVEYNDN